MYLFGRLRTLDIGLCTVLYTLDIRIWIFMKLDYLKLFTHYKHWILYGFSVISQEISTSSAIPAWIYKLLDTGYEK